VELRGRPRRRRGQGQGEGVRRGRLQGRPAPVPAAARRGEADFCCRPGSQGFGGISADGLVLDLVPAPIAVSLRVTEWLDEEEY